MARKRKQPLPQPGDTILWGMPGYSRPGDWQVARVLWTDGVEMLTEHEASFGIERHVGSVERAIAIGPVSALAKHEAWCREQTEASWRAVIEAESALQAARDRMWAELDRLSATADLRGEPAGAESA